MRPFHFFKNSIDKENKLYFVPDKLIETTKQLLNPRRGWYEIYSFNIEDAIDCDELRWSLRENQSVALIRINLKKVRESSLSDIQLENFENILKFFSDAGKEIILRPTYDIEGKGRQNEPETLLIILSHIKQMAPIIKKYKANIFVFQGLLIGSWGEMHTSSYDSPQYISRLAAACENALEKSIFLAVRRPVQLRYIMTEELEANIKSGSTFADKETLNIGLFDDAIFADNSHLGTFGTEKRTECDWQNTWRQEDELAFENLICQAVPNGGEVVYGNMGCDASYVISLLEKMHITYLNCAYDKKLLDIWKKTLIDKDGIWRGKSLYDYVGMHLGYRIVVRRAELKIKSGNCADVRVVLENVGFAPMYESAELVLILFPSNNVQNAGPAADKININEWRQNVMGECTVRLKSGEESFKMQIPLKEGRLYIGMRRKKDGKWIQFATKNIHKNDMDNENEIIDDMGGDGENAVDCGRLLYIGRFTQR